MMVYQIEDIKRKRDEINKLEELFKRSARITSKSLRDLDKYSGDLNEHLENLESIIELLIYNFEEFIKIIKPSYEKLLSEVEPEDLTEYKLARIYIEDSIQNAIVSMGFLSGIISTYQVFKELDKDLLSRYEKVLKALLYLAPVSSLSIQISREELEEAERLREEGKFKKLEDLERELLD
ncbi:MAG: hypothetical protein DSY59_01665 [Persephonella sp.]|nr:MAG: hypothetical protein DSY59_01665 [Persephonella sp.]